MECHIRCLCCWRTTQIRSDLFHGVPPTVLSSTRGLAPSGRRTPMHARSRMPRPDSDCRCGFLSRRCVTYTVSPFSFRFSWYGTFISEPIHSSKRIRLVLSLWHDEDPVIQPRTGERVPHASKPSADASRVLMAPDANDAIATRRRASRRTRYVAASCAKSRMRMCGSPSSRRSSTV